MLDDMFTFIDPIIELNEDATSFVIELDTFFDFMAKTGLDKVAKAPEGTKIEVPLDIALSLLEPDELEKLRNYITFYLAKYPQGKEK